MSRIVRPLLTAVVLILTVVGVSIIASASNEDRLSATGAAGLALAQTCAEGWEETRSSLLKTGAPDGESRRHADLTRMECEEPLAGKSVESAAALHCADDAARRDAKPTGSPGSTAVYFSCMSDVGTRDQPVYRFSRMVGGSGSGTNDTAGRIEDALDAYFAGPSAEEKRLGYMTAIPTPFPDAVEAVSVIDGTVSVSFTPTFERRLGSLATAAADALLLELSRTVLQFDAATSLTLAVGASCQRFWNLLQRTCTALPAVG